jgi:transcription elongation GreA/GreB family factor
LHIVPVELQKPKNEADFERMCAQIYGVVFKDSLPKINGRKGQAQGGVDVFVEADGIGRIGIQCKKYFQTTLAWKHVVEEVDKADKFKTPIQRLLIATTSPNDAALLKKVQILSDDRRKAGKFGVEVEFWDDIEIRIESHTGLQDSYNPGAAGAAFHRQAGELALIKGIVVETRDSVAALDSLPSGSDTSADKLITAQLDRTNDLIKAGCYRDALAHVGSIGKDLGPFDAHQKARWFLQRGLCLWLSKDDVDEAASLFLKASETYPGDERMAAAGIRGLMMRKDLTGALAAGKAASERFPVSLQVWLALANARMLSGERITPEDAPAASRDEPDVLQFAAMSARESGDLAGAIKFARAAAAKPAAGFFNRSLFLRLAMEHCSCEPVLAQYGLIPKDREGRLAEAVATFEPRKERLWDVQSNAVTETAAHLGFAFLLLRKPGSALVLAQEARAMGRASTDLLRVEIQALDESGRCEEALATAKDVIGDLPPEALATACEIAAGDGDVVFVEKAGAEAARRFSEKPEVADYLTGLRWWALARSGRKDAAIADILRTYPASLHGVVLPSVAARVLRSAGKPIEAEEAADRAFAGLAADASAANRLLVADLLSLFERWGEAASLYEGLLAGAGPGPSDLHARLLECYAESDSRGKAKALLSRMPDGWAEHDETRRQAINLGQKAVDWAFLAPLAERQSVKAPGEASSWLFRLNVLMHTAKPAVLQGEVRRIPEDLAGSIRNRAKLAGVELRYDEGAKGLRRLYRLLRQNLDEPEAFSAYLVNLMMGKLPPIDDAPSVVSPGCFVEFEETEGGRRETVVLDPADAGALPKRDGFLPPSDPDAVPFVGAKSGDDIDVPMMAGGVRRVKVVNVGSAYHYMARLAEERARSLGGIPWLKSVQVSNTGDPQKDLARIYEEIRRTSQVTEQLIDAYASGAMTLSMLSKALGRSPVEVCVGWPGDGPPLFVGLGTSQERDAALTLMRNPEAVFVADSTALAELARLQVGHALGALPKVLVSTATKEIVDALAADAESDDSFGSAFDAGGTLGFVEFDDRRKKQRQAFARALSEVVERCEVAPAYGDLGDSENARGMAKAMGSEEREMILLAKERGAVILTLDGRIRMLAGHVFGIKGIWPHALVMRALEAGVLIDRQASAFAVEEFLSSRTFVSLRSEDLTWMASQGDAWLQRGMAELKRYLASAETERDSSLDVALGFLREVASLNTQMGAFGELLFHVAEPMFRRADRRPDLRNVMTGFVIRLLEDAAPDEHILTMANIRRDREMAMRKALLVSRIEEAENRAKSPPSSEPVRIRVLHCASKPWLVLDRSSPPAAAGETGVALDSRKPEDGKSSGMTQAVDRVAN